MEKYESPMHFEKTHKLFKEQVDNLPYNTAISTVTDGDFIRNTLNADELSAVSKKNILKYCFRTAPYIVIRELKLLDAKVGFDVNLIKTNHHNSIIVNSNTIFLLEYLYENIDNAECIYNIFSDAKLEFMLYIINQEDPLEISIDISENKWEKYLIDTLEGFISLLKRLYQLRLIEVDSINYNNLKLSKKCKVTDKFIHNAEAFETINASMIFHNNVSNLDNAHVLLLGDTPGMSTVGLLYLGAYLMRNGIKTYCQFYDFSRNMEETRENIHKYLDALKPKVVGVSMKWFPHMARVLEICRIIKNYSSSIKIVVGGNSASFYYNEIIKYDQVDFVIKGDGELPLLSICQNRGYLPNCVYKTDNNTIIDNPIIYVQDESNSSDIYLSHLEDILLSKSIPLLGTFFIYTHKGCMKNCLYCAGCNDTQKRTFNRPGFFKRRIQEVRNDIIEAKKYASTFMFDFDSSNDTLLEYCKRIWEGIDLSEHFCIFTNLIPASPELINFVNRTFKYVYWNLDMCSLSEKHRKHLQSLNIVKNQPSDKQLLDFFNECNKYSNCEIRICIIAGLPYFSPEDMVSSREMLTYLMNNYSCLSEFQWARLHAQPGAPVIKDIDKYEMVSYAVNFDDFMHFSELNLRNAPYYPNLESLYYPYVYYKNDTMNSQISRHYSEVNYLIERYNNNRTRKALIYSETTCMELNELSENLAEKLRESGINHNSIVGIIMNASIELIILALAISKIGVDSFSVCSSGEHKKVKDLLVANGAKSLDEFIIDFNSNEIYDFGAYFSIHDQQVKPLKKFVHNQRNIDALNSVVKWNKMHAGVLNSYSKNEPSSGNVTFNTVNNDAEKFILSILKSLSNGEPVIIPEPEGCTDIDLNFLNKVIVDMKVSCIEGTPELYGRIIESIVEDNTQPISGVNFKMSETKEIIGIITGANNSIKNKLNSIEFEF